MPITIRGLEKEESALFTKNVTFVELEDEDRTCTVMLPAMIVRRRYMVRKVMRDDKITVLKNKFLEIRIKNLNSPFNKVFRFRLFINLMRKIHDSMKEIK